MNAELSKLSAEGGPGAPDATRVPVAGFRAVPPGDPRVGRLQTVSQTDKPGRARRLSDIVRDEGPSDEVIESMTRQLLDTLLLIAPIHGGRIDDAQLGLIQRANAMLFTQARPTHEMEAGFFLKVMVAMKTPQLIELLSGITFAASKELLADPLADVLGSAVRELLAQRVA